MIFECLAEHETCPLCEQGVLSETVYSDTFRGVFVDGLRGMKCSQCGNICLPPDLIRTNEGLIVAARNAACASP